MTRAAFMRRLLAAPIVGFIPCESRQQPVVVHQTLRLDGREIARAVSKEAKK